MGKLDSTASRAEDASARACIYARTDGRTTRKHNSSAPFIGWAEIFDGSFRHCLDHVSKFTDTRRKISKAVGATSSEGIASVINLPIGFATRVEIFRLDARFCDNY